MRRSWRVTSGQKENFHSIFVYLSKDGWRLKIFTFTGYLNNNKVSLLEICSNFWSTNYVLSALLGVCRNASTLQGSAICFSELKKQTLFPVSNCGARSETESGRFWNQERRTVVEASWTTGTLMSLSERYSSVLRHTGIQGYDESIWLDGRI